MASLLINVNAATIRSISKIISNLSASVTASSDPGLATSTSVAHFDKNFWEPKPIISNDFPFMSGQPSNFVPALQSPDIAQEACDVASLLNEADKRRVEKILVTFDYVCLSLESQIGARQVPMLVVEASVSGEIVSPSSCLSASMNCDITVSYYNDHVNEWEQLLETLPEKNNRLWSLQFDYNSGTPQDLYTGEDWQKLSNLQSAGSIISISSEENLELTLSKTALDVLSKLGRSFEDAYVSPRAPIRSRAICDIDATYIIQNRTGLKLAVILDGQRLKLVKQKSQEGVKNVQTGSFACHFLSENDTIGFCDALVDTKLSTPLLRSAQLPPPRPMGVTLVPNGSGKEDFDFSTLPDQMAAFSIHRTANYLFFASESSPKSKRDQLRTKSQTVPIVASISAFLGQKTLTLRSTLELVNDTPDSIKLFSRKSPSGQLEQTLLTEVEGGRTYCVPVDVVTAMDVTGLLISPGLDGANCSQDVIYWPERACPLTPGSACRDEAAVYLAPLAVSGLPKINFGESTSVENWPVQNIFCQMADANGKSVSYNYTVVIDQGFPVKPIFVSPGSCGSFQVGLSGLNQSDKDPCVYRLIIRTPASLHNQLPIPINFEASSIFTEIHPGNQAVLCSVQSTGFSFNVNFYYNGKQYDGKINVDDRTEDISLVKFETRDGYDVVALNLGLRCSRRPGHIDVTLYSPYWMVNKTGLKLAYKDSCDVEVMHAADFGGVLMYSVTSKSFLGEHKLLLRAENSKWSTKFSLDIAGSWGRLHCEDTSENSYEIGVKIDLSSSGLTKIVTFMPYFMIVNSAPIPIECAQIRDVISGSTYSWISVLPGEAKPFWPYSVGSKMMFMVCRLDSCILTTHFPLYESNTVLLKLDSQYVGLYAEVQTTEEATVINLQLYQEGMALVCLINDLEFNQSLNFYQKGTGVTHTLEPGRHVYYTWDDATKPRQFFVYFDNPQKAQQLEITTDGYETMFTKQAKVHWVSFLSKLQRTMLFTNNENTANAAAKTAEMEPVDNEIGVFLQSIGVSLVDNLRRIEVCYVSVRSSDVKWNKVKRDNRIKPLKFDANAELECAYQAYLNSLRTDEEFPFRFTLSDSIRPKMTVDLNQLVMLEPEICGLRRTFEPGVHLQYRSSPNQMHIHGKIFRIQVDSQKSDATFPVVFAPFPQPASVDLDSGQRPLIEVFALVCRTTIAGVYRFKRLECLIQEMQCKLDQGFLNEMIDFFAGSVAEHDELTDFQTDKRATEGELLDAPVVKYILKGGKASIFDFLHISPIKMHVSFSLVGSSQADKTTAFHSDVLNLFLQSLGVALTDVQDVVFKLGYFERCACIMTMQKITSEMTRHYAGQAIKQTYVLLLGLDVIGNPFGVIRGMAQGVEDLFYEPAKGAVLGTEEFAQGVALGVRSLVGHTVGGAAGAVSRITGTLGKGVAALTLDDEYKRKRREKLTDKPSTFGTAMARGGKDLVMGVFDGVTGIVTQPMEGAKKEGVGGFFKGMTKGLVGVITRPVSGVVDFASSSFEGIRRVASNAKEVHPVRPPRMIALDGVIRPYDLREAQGYSLLKCVADPSIQEDYVFHIKLRRSKSVCLLTSQRILVLNFNEILGTWSSDWSTFLNELDGLPKVQANGLELTLLKMRKKVFGSATNVKLIDCDSDSANVMRSKILIQIQPAETQP